MVPKPRFGNPVFRLCPSETRIMLTQRCQECGSALEDVVPMPREIVGMRAKMHLLGYARPHVLMQKMRNIIIQMPRREDAEVVA